ncbi:glycosyltransferase family 47 protein [Pseudoscourfieldia marina]
MRHFYLCLALCAPCIILYQETLFFPLLLGYPEHGTQAQSTPDVSKKLWSQEAQRNKETEASKRTLRRSHTPINRVNYPRNSSCPFVYVYRPPEMFTTNLLSRDRHEVLPGTKYAQWQTDVYIHEQLLRHKCRVLDPSAADVFFTPLYLGGSADLRSAEYGGERRATQVYKNLIAWIRQQGQWWDRYAGRDHVFVIGAPRAWGKRESPNLSTHKTRGWSFNSLMYGRSLKLTPEINYLNSHDLGKSCAGRGGVADVQVIPYVIYETRPDFVPTVLQHKRSSDQLWSTLTLPPPPSERRHILAYFYGNILPKTAPMRTHLKNAMDASYDTLWMNPTTNTGTSTRRQVNASAVREGTITSDFCFVPPGDTRASKRLFDVFWNLCIPVLFDTLLGLPFENRIPWNEIVVWAQEPKSFSDAQSIIDLLRGTSLSWRAKRRREMLTHRNKLSYFSEIFPNAIDMIIESLATRKSAILDQNCVQPSEWSYVRARSKVRDQLKTLKVGTYINGRFFSVN